MMRSGDMEEMTPFMVEMVTISWLVVLAQIILMVA